MTTVFVVDDHPLYRQALADAVRAEPQLDVVGDAASGREALDRLLEVQPDVAVLDVNLPDMDGAEVARALRAGGSQTRVLFISAHDDGSLVYDALASGGAGFLSKDSAARDICDAVLRVARGEAVLASHAGTALIGQLHERREREAGPALTEREQQVLDRIAEGRSAAQIGEELHLSTATVKTHLQTLYGKLGVSDRGSAVAAGMRRGLVR
jgi:two-component system, NarL family, nitrate/nitrite response regulator NarL